MGRSDAGRVCVRGSHTRRDTLGLALKVLLRAWVSLGVRK